MQTIVAETSNDLILDEFPDETVSESFTLETTTEGLPLDARAKFLADRLTGIGGSDAGTVLGLNQYQTPYELWEEKCGLREPEDLSNNAAVIAGNMLEDAVVEYFTMTTGLRVRRNNRLLRSKLHPFMIAHLDREIIGERSILECKTLGAFHDKDEWGAQGTDQVPHRYLLQCMHYLAVTDRDTAYLAVLIGGRDFRVYVIQRDQELIDKLIETEAEFWNCVQTRTPPVFDPNMPNAIEAVKKLYPGTNGQTVLLDGDLLDAHNTLREQQQIAKDAEALVKSAKAAIMAAMGEASVGRLPDGTCYTRKVVERKGYEVAPSSYVDFRYSAKVMS